VGSPHARVGHCQALIEAPVARAAGVFTLCFELLSILVYELNSSGDLVSLFHLFSIDERNTVNDLGEVREAA